MVDVLGHDHHSALPLLTQQGISPAAPARSTADQASATLCSQTPLASSCRSFLLGLPMGLKHRTGVTAVPPFLHLSREAHGEKSEHSDRWSRSRLKQFNGIRRATTRPKICDKATADTAPAWLLTAPCQPTTGPGEFFAVVEPAAGPDHSKAVLATRAGVHRSMVKQPFHFRSQRCSGNGGHRQESHVAPH